MKEIKANRGIRASQVRLIDETGKQVGVVSLEEALKRGLQQGLDVVEVSPNSVPPVCKLTDLGKYRYKMQKKEKETRKHQQVIVVKEIKFKPKIGEHDYQTKVRHIERFIKEGDKVKVSVKFSGREITHQELGKKILDRVLQELSTVAQVEQPSKVEGNHMMMVIMPRR